MDHKFIDFLRKIIQKWNDKKPAKKFLKYLYMKKSSTYIKPIFGLHCPTCHLLIGL
jgi:hypothetical protein